MAGRADWSLVILSSKTYVFEDKLTEYRHLFQLYSGRGARKRFSCALHPESIATVQHRFQIKQDIYGDKIENKICGVVPRVQCRAVCPCDFLCIFSKNTPQMTTSILAVCHIFIMSLS